MAHLYAVGSPYIEGRTSYPEVVQYNYRGGDHELLIWLASPTPSEVEGIARGRAEFRLLVRPPVITLLYRFGDAGSGMPWSDAPFSWHLVPEEERLLPAPVEGLEDEPHALLNVVLVDANTGIVRALRALTWSPAFTAAMHLAIREQAAAEWPGREAYDVAVEALYRHYPRTRDMLRDATARTTGGD